MKSPIQQSLEAASPAGAGSQSTDKVLLSCLSCSNPDVDAASYGLIELNPSLSKQLLSLHEKARSFLLEIAKEGLVSRWFAPSFGLSDYIFTALRYSEKLDALSKRGPVERVAVISPSEVDSLPRGEEGEESVECFRARLHESGIQFTALSKHGDYEFTTEVIPLDLFRQAAGGISELDRLEALAIRLGLKDGDLDDAVTDLYVGFVGAPAMNETANEAEQEDALSDAESGASKVNNDGLRAQISWLLENAHGGVEETIREAASKEASASNG